MLERAKTTLEQQVAQLTAQVDVETKEREAAARLKKKIRR